MKVVLALILASLVAAALATEYLDDQVTYPNLESRWVVSDWKKSEGTTLLFIVSFVFLLGEFRRAHSW